MCRRHALGAGGGPLRRRPREPRDRQGHARRRDAAEHAGEDWDARFIFLWIAFNAAYATEIDERFRLSEQETFRSFLARLVELDFGEWEMKPFADIPPEGFDRLTEDAGGFNNASTWNDFTNYYETVPANRTTERIVAKLMVDGKRHLAERLLRQALARAEAPAVSPTARAPFTQAGSSPEASSIR